jgi:SulP family sulfate permease
LGAELNRLGVPALPKGVVVYDIAGPMFFAAVDQFEHALLSTHSDPGVLILRLRAMPFIDATGIEAVEECIEKLSARGVRVLLCEANPRVLDKLQTAGLLAGGGIDQYFETFAEAVRTAINVRA